MTEGISPILPRRLNDEGHDYAFPVGDGSGMDMVLHASGAIDWRQGDDKLRQATMPHYVANTIITSLKMLDDLFHFVCRQLEDAQGGKSLNQRGFSEPDPGAHKPTWQVDEKQLSTEVVRQGPRFNANGIDVHLLDDGTSWVQRDGKAREELKLPPDVQRTITSKTSHLIYAFCRAWREYEQLAKSDSSDQVS